LLDIVCKGLGVERRKHKRIKFMRKVAIRRDDGATLSLDVLDYSMGGMALVSKKSFNPGEKLYLESIMTLDGDFREMDMNAEVRYVKKQFEEFALGIQFV